jgi:hypothetical protein
MLAEAYCKYIKQKYLCDLSLSEPRRACSEILYTEIAGRACAALDPIHSHKFIQYQGSMVEVCQWAIIDGTDVVASCFSPLASARTRACDISVSQALWCVASISSVIMKSSHAFLHHWFNKVSVFDANKS